MCDGLSSDEHRTVMQSAVFSNVIWIFPGKKCKRLVFLCMAQSHCTEHTARVRENGGFLPAAVK